MMNCDEFKKHIDDYCLDSDFDWKLRYKMDDHLINCEQCQKVYALTSLVTNKEIMSDPIKKVRTEISSEEEKEVSIGGLKKKLKSLIDDLNHLVSKSSFPFTTFGLATVKGGDSRKGAYLVGERILIHIEAPKDVDRYLTIFHYDEHNNITMLFPHIKNNETLLKPGEDKKIGITVGSPEGKHFLKALLTTKKLIDPQNLNFDSEMDLTAAIERFLNSIYSLDDDWMESVAEFTVTEE